MSYTFEQLKGMTVAQLREIAAGMTHEAVRGYTQLNKEHLLAAICKALNLDMHVHHEFKAAGLDKSAIKRRIKELKETRTTALDKHDRSQLAALRHEMHQLKRSLRKAVDAK